MKDRGEETQMSNRENHNAFSLIDSDLTIYYTLKPYSMATWGQYNTRH